MLKMILAAVALATVILSASALTAEGTWKNGVMFVEEKLAPIEGHTVVKIIFGLEPGKCTGEITAVSEWLIMRAGTMVQSYPGKGDFQRTKGDQWYQPNGTKVFVCNKSDKRAILEGVQFRPK